MQNLIKLYMLLKIDKALEGFLGIWGYLPISFQGYGILFKIFKWIWDTRDPTSRASVMIFLLTDHGRTDGRTHLDIIVQTQGSCKTHIYYSVDQGTPLPGPQL